MHKLTTRFCIATIQNICDLNVEGERVCFQYEIMAACYISQSSRDDLKVLRLVECLSFRLIAI